MTDEDVARIERALEMTLPLSYRRAVVPFPVAAAAGNHDLGVWDDAERLIAFNLELRAGAPGGVKPWPAHFFAIGHAGDGCPHALDLSHGDAVWWVDHGHLDNPASGPESGSFEQWSADYFKTLREEMAGEGVDPDGAPADRARAESRGALQSALGCLLVAALVGLVAIAVRWLMS